MLHKNLLSVICLIIYFENLWASKIPEREYVKMPPLFRYDDYDNCMLYGEEALYCSITYQLQPKNLQNPSETWRIIEKVSSIEKNYKHDQLRHGICIPETCPDLTASKFSQNDPKFLAKLEECYSTKYKSKGIVGNITKISCESKSSPYSYKSFDVCFALFLALFVLLVLSASCYDLLGEGLSQNSSTKFSKFVSSFSVLENCRRLGHVNLENPDIRALRCIQGVRFFYTVSILFGHTVTGNMAIPISNPRYAESLVETAYVKWIGNGILYGIIEICFMVSAWLLTYQFFMELEGKKKVPLSYLFQSVLRRYIRLTPVLAIMVGVHSTWMVHLSRGPFWDQIVGLEYRLCMKNWWSNLLYLNNFVHGAEMCSGHQWYTAVDMQFYALGLLLLTAVWYNKKKIVLILGSLWMFHAVVTFLTIYKNNWTFGIPFYAEIFYDMNIVNLEKTFVLLKGNVSNLGSFVVGMAYGYAFYKYRNQKLFTRKIHVILWRILCFILIVGIVTFPGLMEHLNYFQDQLLYQAIYGTLTRSVFALGFGLWMFGVTQGEGSIIKRFFESLPVYILGRLTYNVFLVHTLFQRIRIGIKRGPNYVDDWSIFFDTVADTGAAFLGAAFLTLFFEMPIVQVAKHALFSRHDKKVDKTVLQNNKTE